MASCPYEFCIAWTLSTARCIPQMTWRYDGARVYIHKQTIPIWAAVASAFFWTTLANRFNRTVLPARTVTMRSAGLQQINKYAIVIAGSNACRVVMSYVTNSTGKAFSTSVIDDTALFTKKCRAIRTMYTSCFIHIHAHQQQGCCIHPCRRRAYHQRWQIQIWRG